MKFKKKIIFLLLISVFFFSSELLQSTIKKIIKKPPSKTAPKPYIKVLSPNGRDLWKLGSMKLIRWKKTAHFTSFRINLLKGNKSVAMLATGLKSNTTLFAWKKVGEYLGGRAVPGDNYRIKVTGYFKNGSINDVSNNYFSITKSSQIEKKTENKFIKKITVLSPTGGKYKTSQKLTIHWKINWKIDPRINYFFVKLYNFSGKKFKKNIGKAKLGSRTFNWTIPSDISPGYYTVKVSDSQKEIKSLSGKFYISRSYKATETSLKIYGKTTNIYRYTYSGDRDGHSCKNYVPDQNPGQGKMRVGSNSIIPMNTLSWKCYYYYLSFVSFNLDKIPKGSFIITAELKYKQYSGGKCYEKVFVLNESWNGGALSALKATYHANPSNFIDVLNNWMAFPNANYGIYFNNGNKSHHSVGFFENIHLSLTYFEPK